MASASRIVGAGRRATVLGKHGLRTPSSSKLSSNSTPVQVARSFSVLESKTDKHLLSEFVGVRGPVAEEVGHMQGPSFGRERGAVRSEGVIR